MTQWEYLVLKWVDIQGVWLNNYGAKGWELVAIVGEFHPDAKYYFKRPLEKTK